MRPPRELRFGNEARLNLEAGIELVVRTVGPTLGPAGGSVVMDSRFGMPEVATSAIDKGFDYPYVARDGLAITSEVLTGDRFVNQGVALAREAARMTKRTVGDGSTTAVTLLAAFVREAFKLVAAGYEPSELEAGVSAGVGLALDALRAAAEPADRRAVAHVAARAARDVELGEAIARGLEDFGETGVLIEKGRAEPLEIEVRHGLTIDRGAVSPYLLSDEHRSESVLRESFVLAVDGALSGAAELAHVLGQVAEAGRPVLVLAHDYDPEALAMLTVNRLRGKVEVTAVTAPGVGESRRQLLDDVAVSTGGTVVGNGTGYALDSLALSDLGEAEEIRVTRKSTKIVASGGDRRDALEARKTLARAEFEEAASVYDRDEAALRCAELSENRFAVLRVGGSTDVESDERRRRAEDGLTAALAARRGGVVAGGGVALLRSAGAIRSAELVRTQHLGAQIVERGLEEPLCTIASNAGLDGGLVVAEIHASDARTGFDAESRGYHDFRKHGLFDPADVVCTALESASFIARRALLSEAIVAQPLSGGRLKDLQGGPANLSMP